MPKFTNSELVSKLANAADEGLNSEGTELSDTRERLLARYHGKYREKQRGAQYSSYNNRDIFETVEWLLAPMIKAFISQGNVVNFDPVNAADEAQAEFETKVVNHLLLKSNDGDGFLAIYEFCKEALLYPNSYAMVDAETTTETLTRESNDVLLEELVQLQNDEAIELTEVSDPEMVAVETPQGPQEVEVFDITYKETRERVKLVIKCLPPEDVILSKTADSVQLKNQDLVAIRMKKTRSDLLKMGYSRAKLDKISNVQDIEATHHSEKIQRLFYVEQEEFDWNEEEISKADREYMLWRFWVNLDYDDDGIAELRRIDIVGDQILENEGTDFCTIAAMSTMVNPHTHVGTSPAQTVEPIEDLKNAVYRQMMDSVYKSEVGKTFVNIRGVIPGGVTNAALQNRTAEYVFMQGPPSDHILPTNPSPLTGELIPLISLLDETIPLRTGVTPRNSTNPATMQNVKTGAVEGALAKATERTELIIRVAAETGIKTIMRLTHQLCRKYPELVRNIKIDGNWEDVRAEDWPERYDVSVNVGLGFNDADKNTERLMALGTVLEKLQPYGLINERKMYNYVKKLIEPMGIGMAEQFIINPSSEEYQGPPEPQPDPQMIIAEASAKEVEMKGQQEQMKLQIQQAKTQSETQEKMQALQLKMQEFQLKAEKNPVEIEKILAEVQAIMSEIETERAKLASEIALNRAQARGVDNDGNSP